MLLLTSRCGQGFFPLARSSDPDIVPCTDGDDGASCAEAGWRDIRLWYLFQCCRFQRPCAWSVFRPVPMLSPAVAGVGATSVLLRNVRHCLPRIRPNSGDERVSLCWLIGTINSCLHLSRPRTVIFWYGCSRCQQLLLSAWLEVVVIYPVRFWIYSVSSRDFSLCVCLARNSELTPFCVVLRLSCSWTPCMSQ